MTLPLVSVCIPTYNGAKYLQEALESVIQQTYKNLEVIISDDNSQDATLEIVREFRSEKKVPVYIYEHKPKGIGANWNYCLQNSKGDYIKFLFQDDILFPSCISEMIEVHLKNPQIGMVASKREIFVEGTPDEDQTKWLKSYKDLQEGMNFGEEGIILLDREFLNKKDLLTDPANKIGEPTTIMLKKSVLKKTGLFNENLVQDLDFEFYYRLLKYSQIGIINKKLVAFRLHDSQTTSVNNSLQKNDSELLDEILLRQFFWCLHQNQQKRLLLKYFPHFRRIIKLFW